MLGCEFISDEHRTAIEGFQCSDEVSVANFLKEQAFGLHHVNSAITRLYFDSNRNLVGYFTLYNDMVSINNDLRKKHDLLHMPRIKYLLAVKLHYLGVDDRYRKQGMGKYLLLEALDVVFQISKNSGCNFMTIESLQSSYEFYLKHGFKHHERNNNGYINMFFNLDELDD